MAFDFDEYRAECADYDDWRLQKEFEKYTRMMSSSSVGTGIAVALAPLTLGLSLLGGVPSGAAYANAVKKMRIDQQELNSRGNSANLRGRDIFGGAAIGGTVGIAMMGVPGHLVDTAVNHTLSHATVASHQSMLKAVEGGANSACLKGGRQLEKKAYGKPVVKELNHLECKQDLSHAAHA